MRMLTKAKLALASRHLFDNWLTLLVRYALTMLGFNTRLTARIGDCAFELSPVDFKDIVKRFSGGFIKSIECVNGRLLVNGVEVDSISGMLHNVETWARVLGWSYDTVNGFWYKGNAKFKHVHVSTIGIFYYEEYKPLNINGRIVIDVGAFVGDSAVYFALRGAGRVIAVEPHPSAFAEMLGNIKLNNMENVIIPINAGLASKPGKICIENVSVGGTGKTYHKPGDCPNAVPAVTLGELIDRFSVNPSDAVLKMDCEGCEFDIILNDYDHVRLFRELILEYHANVVNKTVNDLLKVLSRDYKCDVRGSKVFGVMHCIRR
ncbi:MAG: FkbM family methyltransferase [Caldivirga sp.]